MFSSFSFKAGLLALAVVGGAAVYLNSTLAESKVNYALDGVTTEQSAQPIRHAEVIVTEGRAS